MGAAVDDVHHRHRQHVGAGAADIAVERQVRFLRRRLGDREADAQDGVGAQAGLVRRAVELDQRASIASCSAASMPDSASKISPLTASTAFSTPLPP